MTNREHAMAILNYEDYDRLPLVHFGFWKKTLQKWHREGHITKEEAVGWVDGNEYDQSIAEKLGFDFNWEPPFVLGTSLFPEFEQKVIRELGNGKRHMLNEDGVIVLLDDSISSIPMEISHLLTDRKSWEEHYLPRLQYSDKRVNLAGILYFQSLAEKTDRPHGLYLGSLYGYIRNWLGVEGSCYLLCDDEPLFDEIINTLGELCYRVTKTVLESTEFTIDHAHFWEDICFNTGPLINPAVFAEKVGPHYRRITDLLREYGIKIVSLDCDGCIDALLPIWLENGVNTMFPIEVGTWNASITPWREQYGKELRGVGGMNKNVFSRDRAAIEAEVERLKPLVALGGYIPCPDHRIAPDAKWELVQYYTERMKEAFWV